MPQDNKSHEPHGWCLEAEMLLVAATGYILRKFKGTVGRKAICEHQAINAHWSFIFHLCFVNNFVFRHGIYGHLMKRNRLFWKSMQISAPPVKNLCICHKNSWDHSWFKLKSSMRQQSPSLWAAFFVLAVGPLALPLSWPRQSGRMVLTPCSTQQHPITPNRTFEFSAC